MQKNRTEEIKIWSTQKTKTKIADEKSNHINKNIKWEWFKQSDQKQRMLDWILKHIHKTICYLEQGQFRFKNTNNWK